MSTPRHRSVQRAGRVLARQGRRDMSGVMRGLLATIERGDMAAPAGLVARLEGAVLALDALDQPGAPHATQAAMVDTAGLLRLLADLVDSGQLEADPAMARALEGAADTLAAVAVVVPPDASRP